ncbi:MAG: hypothetical protein Q7K16_01525 [Candidatus Azambacteria bacterium]|nr:hypothetical protein [Candidatus Azambacteria bacterium]
MKHLLLTRPRYELTTHYLYYFAKIVIDFAQNKGNKVYDLKDNRANRHELTSFLSKKPVDIIFLNGHGQKNCICGQNDEILLQVNNNEELLKSKIVYALSCQTAKELGPKAITKGASAYIGYDEDFVFFTNKEMENKPLKDNRAKLFLEPSNQVVISLLKGDSPEEAHKKSKAAFAKNIEDLLTGKLPEKYLARYLYWDLRHQVCLCSNNKLAAVACLEK